MGSGAPLATAMLGVCVITVCAKVLGFGEKVVVSYLYGTTRSADVYLGVMAIFWSVVFIAKELIYPSVLPAFSNTLCSGQDGLSGDFFREAFCSLAKALGIIGLLLTVACPLVIRGLLPGLGPAEQRTACWLLRWLAPGMVFLGLMVLTYTCLNARKRFVVSALGEAGCRLFIVLGLLLLTPLLGIHAIGPALGLGGLCCLAFHMHYLPERRRLWTQAGGNMAREHLRIAKRAMGILLIGVVFSHASGLVDNLLASMLPSGQLSYLTYGRKLVEAIVIIGPVAMVTVMFSQLASLNSIGAARARAEAIAKAVRVLLFISVALACILAELRFPLVRLLFERGRFGVASTSGTAGALLVYAFGLAALALDGLFVYAFYAMSDTRTPVVVGVVFVAANIILAFWLMGRYEFRGIAAALVIAKTAKTIVLGWLLLRRVGNVFGANVHHFFVRLCVASLALWTAMRLAKGIDLVSSGVLSDLLALLLPGAIGLTVYVACSFLVGLEECRTVAIAAKSALKSIVQRGRDT